MKKIKKERRSDQWHLENEANLIIMIYGSE